MCLKIFSLSLSEIILILSLVFSYLSLNSSNWLQISYKSEILTYGLFKCASCPSSYYEDSFVCLKYECISGDDFLCNTGKDLENVQWTLIYSESLALIFSILIIERLTYSLLKRNFGNLIICNFIITILIIIKTIGIILTFYFSSVELDNCTGSVCGLSGVKYYIVSYTCALIGSFLSLFSLKLSANQRRRAIVPLSKAFIFKIFLLLLSSLVFAIVSFEESWISYKGLETGQGSLMYLNDFPYSCYGSKACASDLPADIRHCSAIVRLFNAGLTYSTLTVLSLCFQILWAEHMLYHMYLVNYGFEYTNYLVILGSWICSFAATLAWFSLSGAKFNTYCKIVAGDIDIHFCAELGAICAIISCALLGISGIAYGTLFFFRKSQFKNSDKDINTITCISEPYNKEPNSEISLKGSNNSNTDKELEIKNKI